MTAKTLTEAALDAALMIQNIEAYRPLQPILPADASELSVDQRAEFFFGMVRGFLDQEQELHEEPVAA